MSVVDGEQKDNTPVPAVAQVDLHQLMDLVSARQEPQAAPVDAATQLVASLKAQGYDDDFIKAMLIQRNVNKSDFEQELQKRDAALRAGSLVDRADAFIGGALDGYYEDEPRLEKLDKAIRSEVADRFNANPQRIAEWRRGQLNTREIKKLIDAVVDEMHKDVLQTEKGKKGEPLKAASKQPTAPESDANAAVTSQSIEDLNEHQRAYFNARVHSLKNIFHKTDAEAKEIAFKAAQKLPKPLLKAAR